ncbi:GntR family transcriptional regulator [Oceanirhabdus seepicola]|uniref:GntR family transcriptional regulator n=1 Tax=Oceanirhabdus seepicola TaxID=2828781 RepID=A0A9J6PBZ5_9CLOT|nr:GntR family transcriptional regulator [Oceanirhabdus seepicola]MCM1992384.1 GntR family transcriptional regulator [Oceanirhabdus seepicola]
MKILISNSSSMPIYEQIGDQIKTLILKGDIEPGEPLPSIRMLAKELHISVITTKRAYEELERDGYIETVRGKGSFVKSQNQELLREKKLKRIEDMLSDVVDESRSLGLSLNELSELLSVIYEEE